MVSTSGLQLYLYVIVGSFTGRALLQKVEHASQPLSMGTKLRLWLVVCVHALCVIAQYVFNSTTTREGVAFLERNALKDAVVVTDSGLQYRVLRQGTSSSRARPAIDQPCVVQYRGWLIDGTEFDAGTSTFKPSDVIRGWTEALQMMVVGNTWRLFLNADLAYGNHGSGRDIPPGAVLIFDVELLEIKPRPPSRTETAEKNTKHREAVLQELATEAAEPKPKHQNRMEYAAEKMRWLVPTRSPSLR